MEPVRRLKITEKTIIENKIIGDPSDGGDVIEIVGAGASGTIIRNCEVYGGIRLYGLGKNGNVLREESKDPDFTKNAQAAAPTGVRLENLNIHANRRIPVYFGPGTTSSSLTNSRISGRSVSSIVYLDCESFGNEITGCVFNASGPREVLSIDGSAGNLIENNTFFHSDKGGVYVYRNSGEGGAARHQEPRFNKILSNEFHYDRKWCSRSTIWLGYNSIWRTLFISWRDRDIPYGSGIDNRDFARENLVKGNVFHDKPWWIKGIKNKDIDNVIENNR